MTITVYEKLTFTKRFHYVIYWLLIGLLLFFFQEFFTRISGDTELLPMRALFSFYISLIAIIIINLKMFFPTVIHECQEIISFPSENITDWVDNKILEMGTFSTPALRLFALLIIALLFATVFLLGLPYKTTLSNIIFFLILILFSAVSAHAVYGVGKLLGLLPHLVNYPISPPFYLSKHSSISLLASFYSRTTFGALGVVISLFLIVWQTPYGFAPLLIGWLIFVSFLPLALFLWTFLQVHILMKRIKQTSIRTISERIQSQLNLNLENPDKHLADELEKLMKIQDMVEKMSEWPIAFDGIAALVASIVFPTANIALSMLGLFNGS